MTVDAVAPASARECKATGSPPTLNMMGIPEAAALAARSAVATEDRVSGAQASARIDGGAGGRPMRSNIGEIR